MLGGLLILMSLLTASFNLSAAAMEGSWVAVSLLGLIRIGWRRLKRSR